ncbi:MAG TPA: helix-turn-helix domain-containing protein, partial [Polyangiaceae bacterium LLY-WYZ-15_(1-7)]|nr:helix-turn-helix domain-containing protein [Polyangiaceae bacterium LLY-WYZ-15_(1-7)]
IDTGRGPREGLPEEGPKTRAVWETFEREMRAAGFSAQQVERAKDLWRDFRNRREVRVGKPEVFAAAVEYAIALIHSRRGATQAKIARRYGIAATSLSSRYGEIRDTLALRPGDPRYAS